MRPTPEEDITFIKDKLLPEMVSAGCFDESSRAVKFSRKTIIVRPYPFQLRDYHLDFALYRAQINVIYSNASSTFNVLVKLLPKDCTTISTLALALDGFHNEEYFWKKVSPHVGRHLLPKFYAVEMWKYGRPVVVVEDLEMNGFRRPIDPRQLSTEETIIMLEHIGRLHGKGMALKKTRPQLYMEIRDGFKFTVHASNAARIQRELSAMSKRSDKLTIDGAIVSQLLKSHPYRACREAFDLEPVTICNGFTYGGNMWFKYDEEGNVKEVKLLDWQRACSGSNCLDFALINEEGDHRSYWKIFRQTYYEAVKKEYLEATEKSLFENYSKAGLCYKLLLSTLRSRCVSPPSDGEMPYVPEPYSYCALL